MQQLTTIDTKAIEKAAAAVLDRYWEVLQSSDNEGLANILTDDGMYFGSDPDEIWNKKSFVKTVEAYRNDPVTKDLMQALTFDVSMRKVKISNDGKQAILTDLGILGYTKIPIRITAIMEEDAGTWKMSYLNGAHVIPNAEIGKFDALYE